MHFSIWATVKQNKKLTVWSVQWHSLFGWPKITTCSELTKSRNDNWCLYFWWYSLIPEEIHFHMFPWRKEIGRIHKKKQTIILLCIFCLVIQPKQIKLTSLLFMNSAVLHMYEWMNKWCKQKKYKAVISYWVRKMKGWTNRFHIRCYLCTSGCESYNEMK